MGLIEAIGAGPVALDTALFIYFIEEDPRFLPALRPVFENTDAGELQIVTSAITLLEVLVAPYRVGNLPLAQRYEALLIRGRGVRVVPLDRAQLRAAAQLRALHPGLRTPDALQLAAALIGRCSALVTNDRRLPKVRGLSILQLSDYL